MLHRHLLVTGCPRSGTRYVAKHLCRSAGLNIGHEGVADDGLVCSFFAVDDYYYGGAHAKALKGGVRPRRGAITFDHVWHLVRHPLLFVESLLTGPLGIAWWHWQEKHTGVSFDMDPTERAAKFWLRWNEIVEPQAKWRFRIEDFDQLWPNVTARLGLPPCEMTDSVAERLGQQTTRRVSVAWEDLGDLQEPVRLKAQEYGYE